MSIEWKTGFEVELLAPAGSSRLALAERLAEITVGSVRRRFYPQAELSRVDGKPVFHNLTPAFETLDGNGALVARFVDDLTLRDGLDHQAPAWPGWYRIVSDDLRLVSLLLHNCDPDAPLGNVMAPIAGLFGTAMEMHETGMVRVSDDRGVTVAIAAPLPGARERGCEIITPPLETGQQSALNLLLETASQLGFLLPKEGATHIHFDSTALQSAAAIRRLVLALNRHGKALKDRVGTNPNCVRLGKWPEALLRLVRSDGFADLDWPSARAALGKVGLEKYCDFNLVNIVSPNRHKPTFEVRVLPSHLDAAPIIAAARLFAAILRWASTDTSADPPTKFRDFLALLPLSPMELTEWSRR